MHRKGTDTNIYLHWKAYAPNSWKIGTLKGLFRRAYLVCSTKSGIENEIKHLKYVFTKINGYPSKIVHKTLHDVIKRIERETTLENQNNVTQIINPNDNGVSEVEINPYFCVPYKGKQGEGLMNQFKGFVNKILPNNVRPKFTYKGKKLGSYFKVKDKVSDAHQHNLVYGYSIENEEPFKPDYIGETRVRYETRVHEHVNTDKESSIFKHHKGTNSSGNKENFVICETGYDRNFDRKIAESLYVKEYKPMLNSQTDSLKLKLFN